MYDANFAGDRVKNYKQLVKLCRLIGNVKKAFPPTPDDGDSYFEQCPSTFDQNMLKTFAQKLHSSKARELVKKAKTFQRDTVKTWNPSSPLGNARQIILRLNLSSRGNVFQRSVWIKPIKHTFIYADDCHCSCCTN